MSTLPDQPQFPPEIQALLESRENTLTIVDALVSLLRGPDGRAKSREIAHAVTKLQEAAFWIREDLTLNG